MKRLYALLLLTVITLLTVLPLSSAAVAADNPVVTVGSVSGQVGQTVDVPVTLSKNSGITAFRFGVEYDSDCLELTNVTYPELFSSPASGGNLDADPFIITWFSTESKDETATGEFATLTFRIKEGVKPGDTPININYDPLDLCNSKLNPVAVTTANGKVTMTCEHEWDDFDIGCIHCRTNRLISFVQPRTSKTTPGCTDYRVVFETREDDFRMADSLTIDLYFYDANGKSLRGDAMTFNISTAFRMIYADSEEYRAQEGNCICGAEVTDIPDSIGLSRVYATATFQKGDVIHTYVLGTGKVA